MKQLRIYFVTPGISRYTHQLFTPILSKYYNVIIDPVDPEYVIFSVHQYKKRKTIYNYPKAIKIFFIGENGIPDFNLTDYALGFHNITFGDRYHRLPLWYLYLSKHEDLDYIYGRNIDDSFADRKFCNFVYSNASSSNSIREKLFNKLSEYKRVDSGGKILNNIGGPVEDKMEFIRGYKFTLAIENSDSDGYVTEKIIEPKIMGSIPIYWGNTDALKDFNPKAFIYVNDFDSLDELRDYIEYLDNNPQEYLKILREPMFLEGSLENREQELKDFFDNIFNSDIQKARRTINEGYSKEYYKRLCILTSIQQLPGWRLFRDLMYLRHRKNNKYTRIKLRVCLRIKKAWYWGKSDL